MKKCKLPKEFLKREFDNQCWLTKENAVVVFSILTYLKRYYNVNIIKKLCILHEIFREKALCIVIYIEAKVDTMSY